jgi:hypothetical protein
MKKKLFFLLVSFVLLSSAAFAQNDSRVAPNFTNHVNANPHWMFDNSMDTTNGAWTQIAPLSTGLGGNYSLYWADSDKVWTGGGFDNSSSTSHTENYFYNPVNNTYRTLAPLPSGRAYGKAVKVKNKIYVIGGIGTWPTSDGIVYEYTPSTNTWATKATQPSPMVMESAVCVWRDSLIICIGGQTGGWTGGQNIIRVFDPQANTWTTLASTFPVTMATGHAECIGNEIIEVGGYNGGFQTLDYRGTIVPGSPITINWRAIGNNLWNLGVYRTCGGVWGNYAIFGPSQTSTGSSAGLIWGFRVADSTTKYFLPVGPLLNNRQGTGVRPKTDSTYFYFFGGFNGSAYVTECDKYAFVTPAPPTTTLCEGFTSVTFPPTGWQVIYTGTNWWSRVAASGFNLGVGSAEYNMYSNVNSIQDLVTTTFTPSSAGDSLQFDIAYCQYYTNTTDSLIIFTSTNAGTTYTSLVRLGPAENITTTSCTHPFTPTQASDWGRRGYPVPVGTNMIKFEGASGFGDNLYLDSICVGHIVGIINPGNGVPKVYSLSQNYPNPFNPTTVINYSIPKAGSVELKVYDLLGREVMVLFNGFKQAGTYSVNFNASNLASGVYFYLIKSGDFTATKKMLLIK